MGGGVVWKSLCLGGGLVQCPQHIVQSKGSCRAARIIPFFKFRGILINSRENVTQEIKKQTNKQEVFSTVFFSCFWPFFAKTVLVVPLAFGIIFLGTKQDRLDYMYLTPFPQIVYKQIK